MSLPFFDSIASLKELQQIIEQTAKRVTRMLIVIKRLAVVIKNFQAGQESDRFVRGAECSLLDGSDFHLTADVSIASLMFRFVEVVLDEIMDHIRVASTAHEAYREEDGDVEE